MDEDLFNTFESVAWVWRLLAVYPFVIKGPAGSKTYAISTVSIIFALVLLAGTIKYCQEFIDLICESFKYLEKNVKK